MRINRSWVVVIAVATVISACGGGTEASSGPSTTAPAGDTTVTQPEPATQTTRAETAAGGEQGVTTTVSTRPAPDPNREIAPDFDLALSDGSTFVLSEETRPVFMVFWAEW